MTDRDLYRSATSCRVFRYHVPLAGTLVGVAESEVMVNGMTCEHCAEVLRMRLSSVARVARTAVRPATAHVQLWHPGERDREAADTAVQDAGYEVASWAQSPQ